MNNQFDALILGSGVAGLSCAIELVEKNYNVCLVSNHSNSKSINTFWAQGGIVYPMLDDQSLENDIQMASGGTSNPRAIEILLENGPRIFNDFLIKKIQPKFNMDESGNFKYTKEAAHSKSRIVYSDDQTGKEILQSLIKYIENLGQNKNLTILKNHTGIDLITPNHHGVSIIQRYDDHKVIGAYVLDNNQSSVKKIIAKQTIVATGGMNSLYLHHTNSESARGDGIAMAKRAQAQLINMEFVQFHPTAFFDRSHGRRFLISEALRGEGGILVNSKGERYMEKYHQDKELAPRDVVSKATMQEMIMTNSDCVYLDISKKNSSWIIERFPTIYQHCLSQGHDMTASPIPVVPAAHYSCGGVKVNLNGESTVPGLYAIGEAACNGLHGKNRLASMSLLEGIIFGVLTANHISEKVKSIDSYDETKIKDWKSSNGLFDQALIDQDWHFLKQTLWNYVGLIRSDDRLKRAQAMINELREEVFRFYKNSVLSDSLIGLRNAIEVSQVIIDACLRSPEEK